MSMLNAETITSSRLLLHRAFLSAALFLGAATGAEAATRRPVRAVTASGPTMVTGFQEIRQGDFYAQIDPTSGEVLYATQGTPGAPGSVSFAPRLGQQLVVYGGAEALRQQNLSLLQRRLINLRGAAAPRLQALRVKQEVPAQQLAALAPERIAPVAPVTVASDRESTAVAVQRIRPQRAERRQDRLAAAPIIAPPASAASMPNSANGSEGSIVLAQSGSRANAPSFTQQDLDAARTAGREEAMRELTNRLNEAQRQQTLNTLTEQRVTLQELRRAAAAGQPAPDRVPEIAEPIRDAYTLGLRSDTNRLANERRQGSYVGAAVAAASLAALMVVAGYVLARRRRKAQQKQQVETAAKAKDRLKKVVLRSRKRHETQVRQVVAIKEHEKTELLQRLPIIMTDDAHYPYDPNQATKIADHSLQGIREFVQDQGFHGANVTLSVDKRRVIVGLSPVSYLTITKDSVTVHGRRTNEVLALALGLGFNEVGEFKESWDALALQQIDQPSAQSVTAARVNEQEPTDIFMLRQVCDIYGLTFGPEGNVRPRGVATLDRPMVFKPATNPATTAEAPAPAG